MKIWFRGKLFENSDSDADKFDDVGDAVPGEDGGVEQQVSRKVDPEIAIKRVNLSDRLYSNIIDFIRFNVGDVNELNIIRENQTRIHDLFNELAHEVSSEYNAHKGKNKEKVNVREDATMRKIQSMYRFFAYYIIKYDRQCVDWMESLIRVGLFNDKTQIKNLNGAYSNIDLSLIDELQPYELVPQSFNILHNDTVFNKTLGDFFKDSGDLVERLARGPGLFNDLSSMMVSFRRGITVEYYVNGENGERTKKITSVPVSKSPETQQIIEAMLAIEAVVNKLVTVEVIREKYIADYTANLHKLNMTQEQISGQLKILRDAISGGKINTVEDFDKIQSQYKKMASTDKEKENLGNRVSKMASAYKFKVESVLNNRRGQ